VRLAAAHAAGLNLDRTALPLLLKLLQDEAVHVRREAATGLGRLKDKKSGGADPRCAPRGAPTASSSTPLIYALIQIDDRDGTLSGLADTNPNVRRAALIALDQMDHGRAQPASWSRPHLDPSNLAAPAGPRSSPSSPRARLGRANCWAC